MTTERRGGWPGSLKKLDLRDYARQLAAARRALDEQMAIARAAALQALEQGQAEAAVARELGVDRMTVRKWAGK